MTEIFLVRHPESVLNADRSVIGGRSENAPVTERGLEQARRFAVAFSKLYPKPDAFFSSPTVRTKTLLDVYNETLGEHNEYDIDSDLLEMSQGEKEGANRTETYSPEVLEVIAKKLFDFSFKGGESLNETADRIDAWVQRTSKQYPDGTILAATHGQSTRAYAGRQLGWTHFETTTDPAHATDNVSLTHISVNDGKATVNFWGKDIIEPVENDSTEL